VRGLIWPRARSYAPVGGAHTFSCKSWGRRRHYVGMDQIAALFRRSAADPRTDGGLLAAFLNDRDEPAFAELVRRHGPLVWGVCRRALPSTSDAEDAFQATFLVLVSRAGGLLAAPTVGPWLFKVASQTAGNVRRKNSRRLALFTELPEAVPDPRPVPGPTDLDAVLSGLPERCQAAVLLCYLEGLTHGEAAARLGCPEGTVSSLLSRGLATLRAKFAGRDPRTLLAFAGIAAPTGLAAAAARSAVSLRIASLSAAASPAVAALTRGVIRMFWIKKAAAVGLAVAALFAAGIGFGMPDRLRAAARENPKKMELPVANGPVARTEAAGTAPSPMFVVPGAALEANMANDDPDKLVYGPIKGTGGRDCYLRSAKVGEKVEVEGLALGEAANTQRVVYEGSKVFLKAADFKELKADGKLVRVRGVLRYDGGALVRLRNEEGGYTSGHTPAFFYIESTSVELIDRVTVPRLVLRD
jgi:RNA polymerase sigma factor (sigma-70 family)